jgi:hypothetical protein
MKRKYTEMIIISLFLFIQMTEELKNMKFSQNKFRISSLTKHFFRSGRIISRPSIYEIKKSDVAIS